MVSIYCLKLQHGKYYVGKTRHSNFRISDHFDGYASEWTRLHKPLSVYVIEHNCDDFDEDKFTKMAMAKFGIDNVRGGTYSQVTLSNPVRDLLQQEIRGADDLCFKCGRPGHFASECYASRASQTRTSNVSKNDACFKCGRMGHYASDCVICYKCGNPGHYADECYAKKKASNKRYY